MFEEARAVELDERLRHGCAGPHAGASLLARRDGERVRVSLGWPEGGAARAGRAGGPRLRPIRQRAPRRHASGRCRSTRSCSRRRAADVDTVVVGGRGDRPRRPAPARRRGRRSWRGRCCVSTLALDNIGLLVTCDRRSSGVARAMRALVIEDGAVVVDRARRRRRGPADRRGRALRDPGLRRQPHASGVRRRSRRGVRRADGRRAVRGGRDPHDGRGHPRGLGRASCARSRRRGAREGAARRDHACGDQVRATRWTSTGEARLCALAAELTDDVTFLGAHVVPAESTIAPTSTSSSCAAQMLDGVRARTRAGSTCSASAARSTLDQSRAVLEAGRRRRARAARPREPARARPGVQLAVELGAASADHCTYLTDDDVEALAGSDTVATFLPATDFATRQPYPDARRAARRRRAVALATNTQPRLELHDLDGVLHRTRGPRHADDASRRRCSRRPLGGARALRRDDIGRLAPGCRADVVILDAPSPAHFAYRPGVPLVAMTLLEGAPIRSR